MKPGYKLCATFSFQPKIWPELSSFKTVLKLELNQDELKELEAYKS